MVDPSEDQPGVSERATNVPEHPVEAPRGGFFAPEYRESFGTVMVGVSSAQLALDPLLGKIGSQTTGHRGPVRVAGHEGPIDQPPVAMESVFKLSNEVVRNTDLDTISAELAEVAEHHVGAVTRHFFAQTEMVIEKGGQTFDMKGQPFTHERFLEVLESMEIHFDEHGKHDLTLIVPPELHQQLANNPPTEAQHARYEEIMRRKKEEHDATRRTRRLPRSS